MKRAALAIALSFAVPAAVARAENLTNEKVVQLSKVGLGDDVVIAKIKQSSNSFDVSTDALIALKKQGVSSPVIAAMIGVSNNATVSVNAVTSADSPDPRVPHPSGIYLLADWLPEAKMTAIDPTTSNQTKTGGFFGYALTGGIASMSMKTVIPGPAARVVSAQTRPTFFFYFDQAQRSLSNSGAPSLWLAGTVTSPNEFSLIRFKVKDARREAAVGKLNIGGAKAGVMDKDRIAFSYAQVLPGVFEVRPDSDLPPGEYGFIYSSSTGGGSGLAGLGAMTSKIFDFSIPATGGAAGRKAH